MPLSRDDLAREAESMPDRIDRLVAAGIIRPSSDGSFSEGDVQRARLVAAFESVGITIDQLERAVGERFADFSYLERFYPPSSPRSGRSYAAFVESLGDRSGLLGPVLAVLGLAEPAPGGSLTEEDERTLEAFLGTWDLGSDEVTIRAARIAGDAVQRFAQGWVELFYEQVSDPVQRRMIAEGLPVEEIIPEIVPKAARVADLAPAMLDWLRKRHIEQALYVRNVAAAEEQYAAMGIALPRPAHPPAIVFADVSGYTRLTETRGDEEAIRVAVRLGELAEVASRRHGGRLVKLLGDGALMRFDSPGLAVVAALDMVDQAPGAGLPPVYAGIHAGPIITRDGDVYGHTVNVASRIGGAARAGEVFVTADVVAAIGPEAPVSFEPLGATSLKGVTEPLELYRARRTG